jgi:exopolysaccharide biosynthesis polyprenyl glycosylphosphotransferase
MKPRDLNAGDDAVTTVSDNAMRNRISLEGVQMLYTPVARATSDTERRRPSSGPRRSWTDDPPFVEPSDGRTATFAGVGWRHALPVYRSLLVAADFTLTFLLVFLTALIQPVTHGVSPALSWLVLGSAAAGLLVCAVVAACHGYDLMTLGDGADEYQALLWSLLVTAGGVGLASLMFELNSPRDVVILGLPVVLVLGWILRHVGRRILHRRRFDGRCQMRTLLVGDPLTVKRLQAQLEREPYHGYDVVGVCLPAFERREMAGIPAVLGAIADIPQVVVDQGIDAVVVGAGQLFGDSLRRLSWAIGRTHAELVVAPGIEDVLEPRLRVRPTAGLSLLHVQTANPRLRLFAKSVLDRILAGALLVIAAPLLAVAAIAIRIDDHGPAFFRQTRIGEGGRAFTMWKLRTMYIDAEERRLALLASTDRDGPMFKMRLDPRITRVGRTLRRMSLDELPQLFNVLLGDMSLVGPRPPLPSEVETYHDAVARRLLVRPGLTGLWQVSGRADLSWEESIHLDLRYVDNWSFAMDAQILWRTVRAVFGGRGAY